LRWERTEAGKPRCGAAGVEREGVKWIKECSSTPSSWEKSFLKLDLKEKDSFSPEIVAGIRSSPVSQPQTAVAL